MKIIIQLTEKEKELIALFKKHESLSVVDNMKGWGDTDEFNSLREADLIYHSNHRSTGAYIEYSLTELGEEAFKQNCQ